MKQRYAALVFSLTCLVGVVCSTRETFAGSLFTQTMPSIEGATTWLNTRPLSSADLRGKVVLVDFWTYTCINWRRTLPYLRLWYDKYRDQGLVIVGVHTPEFSFEKDANNVRRAVLGLQIKYPVAVDSSQKIWNAFHNQYWPALYIVDAEGHIAHRQFGEGGYEESERIIQQLLRRSGAAANWETTNPEIGSVEQPADLDQLRSPESYLGFELAERFVSPGGQMPGVPHTYEAPRTIVLNSWALTGNWTAGREAAVLNQPGGRVIYRFHARDLNLVMSPGRSRSPVRFRVRIDGQVPGASHGIDVDERGDGAIDQPRMYQLIRQVGHVPDRQFEIEFLDPEAEVFDFTFG